MLCSPRLMDSFPLEPETSLCHRCPPRTFRRCEPFTSSSQGDSCELQLLTTRPSQSAGGLCCGLMCFQLLPGILSMQDSHWIDKMPLPVALPEPLHTASKPINMADIEYNDSDAVAETGERCPCPQEPAHTLMTGLWQCEDSLCRHMRAAHGLPEAWICLCCRNSALPGASGSTPFLRLREASCESSSRKHTRVGGP
jgi:hypothetical protein